MVVPLISVETCGSCRFTDPIKEDLTLVHCMGMPPQLLGIPTPQGIQISPQRPRMPRSHPRCALYERQLAVEASKPIGSA